MEPSKSRLTYGGFSNADPHPPDNQYQDLIGFELTVRYEDGAYYTLRCQAPYQEGEADLYRKRTGTTLS